MIPQQALQEAPAFQPDLYVSTADQPAAKRLSRKLPAVQMLRGFAAALVVFHHSAGVIPANAGRAAWVVRNGLSLVGASGVDIFFVISGFIMFYTNTRGGGHGEAGHFLWKRILRIYPLYWLWTSVLASIAVFRFVPVNHVHGAAFYVASYLLIPVYNGSNFHPFLDQGWTLSFEMLFYLIFAIGLWFHRQKSIVIFLAMSLAVTFLLGQFLPASSGIGYLFSNTLPIEFLFGVALAKVFVHTSDKLQKSPFRKWLPVGLVALGSVMLACTSFSRLSIEEATSSPWRFVFWGVPSLLIVAGFAYWNQKHTSPVLVFLGDASYSTYLMHTFILGAVLRFVIPHGGTLGAVSLDVQILVLVLFTILLTLPAYQWVEKPLTSLVRRLSAARNRPYSELRSMTSQNTTCIS